MCPEINRYVNYVPIAKVKGWEGGTIERGERSREEEARSQKLEEAESRR